jgi:hypothetical protein
VESGAQFELVSRNDGEGIVGVDAYHIASDVDRQVAMYFPVGSVTLKTKW